MVIPERDGRTDRRTEFLYQYRESVCWRAIKTAGIERVSAVLVQPGLRAWVYHIFSRPSARNISYSWRVDWTSYQNVCSNKTMWRFVHLHSTTGAFGTARRARSGASLYKMYQPSRGSVPNFTLLRQQSDEIKPIFITEYWNIFIVHQISRTTFIIVVNVLT